MKVVKITKSDLLKLIEEEAKNIAETITEEKAVEKAIEPTEVDMNKNDKEGDSDKALVYKDPKKKEEKSGEDAKDVKMNAQDKDQGSDEKAATAVEVKAGAKKGGNDANTGQHAANFTSKDKNPKKEVSAPFEDSAKDEMNTMDKLTDEKTKTYVDAGAKKGGNDVTAGQHKADVHEKAPVVKDEAPIATGILLKENYKKSELKTFILSEAKKLAKKMMLEDELSSLTKQINDLKK